MKRKNTILLIITICLIGIIALATYAWYNWRVVGVSGNVYDCFNIDYSNGGNITGILPITDNYINGNNTTITIKINASCTRVYGTGDIILDTNYYNDTSSNSLIQLGTLRYAVREGSNLIAIGTVLTLGDTVIASDFDLATSSESAKIYTVYLWVDNNLASTSNLSASYSGTIRVNAKMLGDETIE